MELEWYQCRSCGADLRHRHQSLCPLTDSGKSGEAGRVRSAIRTYAAIGKGLRCINGGKHDEQESQG